jgi:hypothetical protein
MSAHQNIQSVFNTLLLVAHHRHATSMVYYAHHRLYSVYIDVTCRTALSSGIVLRYTFNSTGHFASSDNHSVWLDD